MPKISIRLFYFFRNARNLFFTILSIAIALSPICILLYSAYVFIDFQGSSNESVIFKILRQLSASDDISPNVSHKFAPLVFLIGTLLLLTIVIFFGVKGFFADHSDNELDFYKQLNFATNEHFLLLKKYTTKFDDLNFKYPAQIAAGELFTEKAQIFLTYRGNSYYLWGAFFVASAAFTLCFGIMVISSHDAAEFINRFNGTGEKWGAVVVYFVREIAIGGLFGGALYFFASLARAYFHEGTVLFNRRHATRLGRLYMLLKYGQQREHIELETAGPPDRHGTPPRKVIEYKPDPEDLARAAILRLIDTWPASATLAKLENFPHWMLGKLEVDPKELEEAFGWNLSQSSAFKDMKPEKMTASLYVKMAEALGAFADKAKREAESDPVDKPKKD
jgi:hypothetical protein